MTREIRESVTVSAVNTGRPDQVLAELMVLLDQIGRGLPFPL